MMRRVSDFTSSVGGSVPQPSAAFFVNMNGATCAEQSIEINEIQRFSNSASVNSGGPQGSMFVNMIGSTVAPEVIQTDETQSFSNSSVGTNSSQAQESHLLNMNGSTSTTLFSPPDEPSNVSMVSDMSIDVENTEQSIDNCGCEEIIPPLVEVAEDATMAHHNYAVAAQNNDEVNASELYGNFSVLETLKQQVEVLKKDIIGWMAQGLRSDLSNILERLWKIEGAIVDLDKKLDNYGTRNLDLVEQVQNLTRVVNKGQSVTVSLLTLDDLWTSFNCHFPLDNLDAFIKFDEGLKESESLKATMTEFLENRVTRKMTPAKTMGSVLRKFLTREVIKNYTATKKSGDKLIFCDTQLYKLIEGPMMHVREDKDGNLYPESQVKSSVGGAINNSSDWGDCGGRAIQKVRLSSENEHASGNASTNTTQ
ncbi:hypothetical protein QAD02_003471 [Eretmocerus hayati]|uniref:Uncharacterized protein n=1 Tax=Eretmocerus hayati TaxID=131215 RepID=A0ACC2NM61_9HYME|nr:hypothetical protein QAD02_003471 [Eretmocerus hayati]